MAYRYKWPRWPGGSLAIEGHVLYAEFVLDDWPPLNPIKATFLYTTERGGNPADAIIISIPISGEIVSLPRTRFGSGPFALKAELSCFRVINGIWGRVVFESEPETIAPRVFEGALIPFESSQGEPIDTQDNTQDNTQDDTQDDTQDPSSLPPTTPIGTVVAYAGKITDPSLSARSPSTVPVPENNIEAQGWMICDGRSLKESEFPELFAVLGYLYGGSDGLYHIPDLRGQFLRIVTASSEPDPGIDQRTMPEAQPEGQPDAQPGTMPEAQPDAQPDAQPEGQTGAQPGTMPEAEPLSDEETRPQNVDMYYVIKYTNQPSMFSLVNSAGVPPIDES